MPKELDLPRKGLINIQNINDSECFKWCWVRYLHPTDHNPRRIRKVDKLCRDELDFKDTTFSELEILTKFKEKIYLDLCIKKCCGEKQVDLLLIGEEEKKHYVILIGLCMITHCIVEENIIIVIV